MPALNRRDLPGLLRAMDTSPNAQVKATAWRLAHENFPADPRVAKLQRPMGSKALALYEKTRQATTAAERRELIDTFARATDNWTKSAIAAGAVETAPAAYVAESFAGTPDEDLADLVAVAAPGALPAEAARLLAVAAKAGADASPLKAALARSVAQMSGTLAMDGRDDRRSGRAARRSRRDRGHAADRRQVGHRRNIESRGRVACRGGRASTRRRVGERRGPRRGCRRPHLAAVAARRDAAQSRSPADRGSHAGSAQDQARGGARAQSRP